MDRDDEADALVEYHSQIAPDYPFVRLQMALRCIQDDELDEAHEWLDPLLNQNKQIHSSVFASICNMNVQLLMEEDANDGDILEWLDYWEWILPYDEAPDILRKRLTLKKLIDMMPSDFGEKKSRFNFGSFFDRD